MGKRWIAVGLMILMASMCLQKVDAEGKTMMPLFSCPDTAQPIFTRQETALEFPFVLRGTELIVQQLAAYDGSFLESGGEEPVAGVAALMIYNPTAQGVAALEVGLVQGEETLHFALTYLPPKSRILVLEKEGKSFSQQPVTACRCTQIVVQDFGLQQNHISVAEKNGKLQITNLTTETLFQVVVYHKQYYREGEFYLGGITYQTVVEELSPGESREILPEFYSAGYCRAVAAQWKK